MPPFISRSRLKSSSGTYDLHTATVARRRAPTPAHAQTRRGVPAAPDASTARDPLKSSGAVRAPGDGGPRRRRAAGDRRLKNDRPGRARARLLRRARRRACPRPPRRGVPRRRVPRCHRLRPMPGHRHQAGCVAARAPAPRSSQPGPNGDPAGVGRMPESLIIAFVLIGISVGKDAHRPVERVPGAEIAADRDRVA